MDKTWQDAFRPKGGGSETPPPFPPSAMPEADEDDLAEVPDPSSYRPWIVQRGRGRPAMFLDLRKFDPRTGDIIGSQVSYPSLIAIDYLGDHLVSLDFGHRHYVIEGTGLGELARRLQQGAVLAIQEFSGRIWQQPASGPIVTKIEKVGM